ncbi:thiol reductant ABC exporter subunit CydD [Acidovorax sp. MR-S7]|uniref:thiol reductant ABC exporter subunit CydD n=1 Tax=Acidovorax sp. MR-S7 TaxID=1268622 RepID=UPI00036B7E35|nr:thiol reductant ABC exporter subunit CydD [Acidovorax sp. MR-S7]GAD24492.1 ABC-type transport system involved in cytochrome bd biosynthesis, ATPase and permease components [Acidovorax sp. MR-S7]
MTISSARQVSVAQLLHTTAPLWWLPQAALLALAVARLQAGGGLTAMLQPAAGIILLGLLRAACEAWSAARLFDSAREQLTAWRHEAVQALAERSPLDRQRIPAGAAASALAEQAEAILPWLTRYQGAIWRVRVVPLLILLPVAWFSWAAAAVLLLAAPLIPLFMVIIGWRAKAASEAQWLQLSDMNAFLLDRLRGLPTLQALDAVDTTEQRLHNHAEDLRQRTMRVLRIAFLSSAVLELFAALGVAMVAAYVGFHLLGYFHFGAWGQRLGLAEGLFVLLLAPTFFEPVRELAAIWHDRASGEAAQAALYELGVGGLSLPDGHKAAQLHLQGVEGRAVHAPGVRMQGLSFGFEGEQPLFQGFDLDVRPGEHVALVGESGTGKTVLLSLLAGLVPATAGLIEVGGVPLTDASLPRLRSRMAWMGQHPHLFAGSVQHNVSLGRSGVDRHAVQHAMRVARLDGVAQAYPGAALGEGGTGLSGGEGARLALARLVVAKDIDLLLLDEPTAHLDSETAAQIVEAIKILAQGRTLIVATHDPQLVAWMDRSIDVSRRLDACMNQRKRA